MSGLFSVGADQTSHHVAGFRDDDEEPAAAARPMQGPAVPEWVRQRQDSGAAAPVQRPRPSSVALVAAAAAVAAARKARKKEKKEKAKQKLKAAKDGKSHKRKKAKRAD